MVDRVGERFGDYRLKRLISDRGAFADVYEAEHVVDQTKAAVKVWKVQIEDRIFLNDIHAAVLDHPHIVKILDFGIKGDIPYLVMVYAPHGSLKAQPLPLPLHSIVAYAQQIAHALDYAHRRGIVHRDIKPDNILLSPQHEIWVGDFGIATPSFTRQDTLLREPEKRLSGTPDYMAPEQWSGNASPASDQYALGILVYECLCGKRPFNGDAVALGYQHTSVPPPSLREKLSSISPTMEQVVMKALEKEPEKRFASVVGFAQALDQAYQAEQRTVALLVSRGSSSGTLLYSYQVPPRSDYSFSWMQNRPRLVTRDAEGKVEAWDFTTGSLFSQQIEGQIEQISWSPNGHCLACLFWSQNELTTKLQLWNLETGNCFATYPKALGPLIWSPDSTCVAFHSYKNNPQDDYGQYFGREPFSYQHWLDGYVYKNQIFQIWDIDRAQLISTVSTFTGSTGELIPLNKAITSLQDFRRLPRPVWSPDSKHIAFSPRVDPSGRWVIPVYEVATGNFITAYPLQHNPAAPPKAYFKQLWSVEEGTITWSPDAAYIACRFLYLYKGIIKHDDGLRQKLRWHSQEAQIWAIATQSEITPRSPISTLAWSPDSACVALPGTKQRIDLIEDGSGRREIHTTHMVEIWEISDKSELLEAYEGHTEPIVALAWSPDNKYIASVSGDGNIHIWDAHSAKRILILETHEHLFFSKTAEPNMEWSPDGTQLAYISPYGLIQIWQVV